MVADELEFGKFDLLRRELLLYNLEVSMVQIKVYFTFTFEKTVTEERDSSEAINNSAPVGLVCKTKFQHNDDNICYEFVSGLNFLTI